MIEADVAPCLRAGGVAGEIARGVDWSRTPLGPVSSWSHSLRSIVATVLRSRHPMFLFWGPDLVQLYNDAYVPSFGVGKHPAAMGQRGADCWPEIWHIIGPQLDAVMHHGEPSWNEDQLVPIYRNGALEDVYWSYSFSPVLDDDGSVGGTLVVCTETTRRVLMERRLRALHLVAQAAGASATEEQAFGAVLQLEGRIDGPFVVATRQIESGETVEVAVGIGLSDASELAARPLTVATFEVVLQVAGERRGRLLFGIDPRVPLDADYAQHMVAVGREIEQALDRIEAFRATTSIALARDNLLLQAPIGAAILTGPDLVFELANRRYVEMVGRDVLGKPYFEAFPELVGTELGEVVTAAFEKGERFVAEEMSIWLVRDGVRGEAVFRFILEPVRDGAGRVLSLVAVAIEVTALVLARRTAQAATKEQERLLAELADADRAKDTFLAMLGHELRNPLAAIVSALEVVRRDPRMVAGPTGEILRRQTAHLVRLVDDLLDVSRATRGAIALRIEDVSLTTAVEAGIEQARPLVDARRHTLQVAIEPDLHIRGDVTRVAQIVSNLVTNAARYTPPGGHVTVSAARRGEEVEIRVADDGIGMEPELLARVFEPFVQRERSDDPREGGLGIGLTLVRHLATRHGGSVEARSPGPGGGTEVEVRLPLAPGPVLPEVSRPDAASVEAPRRVLVVDDNVDGGELLVLLLGDLGHEARHVADGPAALAVLDEYDADVVVLDIGLPGMDGYEVARRIRARGGAVPRLVALTGYVPDSQRAREAGIAHHILKPVRLEILLAALAT